MFGTIIAFKHINYQKGILGSDWVGLKNFKFLFATNDAWVITRNTLLYNLAFIVINTVVGIILAIFICDVVSKKLKKQHPKLDNIFKAAIIFCMNGNKSFFTISRIPQPVILAGGWWRSYYI